MVMKCCCSVFVTCLANVSLEHNGCHKGKACNSSCVSAQGLLYFEQGYSCMLPLMQEFVCNVHVCTHVYFKKDAENIIA